VISRSDEADGERTRGQEARTVRIGVRAWQSGAVLSSGWMAPFKDLRQLLNCLNMSPARFSFSDSKPTHPLVTSQGLLALRPTGPYKRGIRASAQVREEHPDLLLRTADQLHLSSRPTPAKITPPGHHTGTK